MSYALQFTPKGFASAIKQFELALKLDPLYSRAKAAIAQMWYIKENSGLC
ncbi:MAG: hypothetical protein VX741_12915 [Pseudomonadota bacterium]|nr:hypothetical protein [Pseudomonadota bacterium]